MPSSRARVVQALLPLLVLASAACNQPTAPTQTKPDVAAPAEAIEPEQSPDAAERVPVIASDEATFNFGDATPGKPITHVFKLVNRGSADLHIEKVERT